jgi:hypothetical protein
MDEEYEEYEERRLVGAELEKWSWMLLGPLLPMTVSWFGLREVTVLSLFLFLLFPPLLVLAISALILSRSTSTACDFLSVFFTKLAMITLQRISTSSRR